MNAAFEHLNKNKIIYFIILLFLIAKLLTLSNYKIVWWDSAVYIGMGKYIYSLGNAGLWEYTRPVVWPLILGAFWKMGFDVILFGRIIEILLGSLCILLAYLIGKKVFNEEIALLSSIFLALSPTFFFFNGVMLTEIVSTFFSLLAIYFFIGNKYFASGAFLGTAFMTRYLQLFVFIAMIIPIFNKKNTKNIKKILLGFVIAITPFLVINQIMYNNALFPFFQQIFLSKNSGWLNHQPLSFYFIGLLKENFLYLLSILGLFLAFKNKNTNKISIALAFVMLFIFFNLINQKEMRFLIILFPYMYLLISSAIFHLPDYFKAAKNLLYALVVIFVVVSFTATYNYYRGESGKINEYADVQAVLEKTDPNAKIWISNPITAVFSNKKIDNLMYYPVFDERKKEELITAKKPDFVFFDSCDLACRDYDNKCENAKKELTAHFKKEFKIINSNKINQCEQFAFAK